MCVGHNLKVHENIELGVHIGGLKTVDITSPEVLHDLIDGGKPLSLSLCLSLSLFSCLFLFLWGLLEGY